MKCTIHKRHEMEEIGIDWSCGECGCECGSEIQHACSLCKKKEERENKKRKDRSIHAVNKDSVGIINNRIIVMGNVPVYSYVLRKGQRKLKIGTYARIVNGFIHPDKEGDLFIIG